MLAEYFTSELRTAPQAQNFGKATEPARARCLSRTFRLARLVVVLVTLTNVNGTIYFRASDGTAGYELWKSDGYGAGTVLVKGHSSQYVCGNPGSLINLMERCTSAP